MGKRSRNRNCHKHGRNHFTDDGHINRPPNRRRVSVKYKPPRTDSLERRVKSCTVEDVNENFFFEKNTMKGERTSLSSFSRSLTNVDFVYPEKDGVRQSYFFNKSPRTLKSDHASGKTKMMDDKGFSSTKSLEEILNPTINPPTSDDSPPRDRFSSEKVSLAGESAIYREYQLSGRSVEDAVRDRVGCRPRSNSTDGELNLPQRGLCDERSVLESYRWRFDRCEIGRGKPRGFKNLGNTCYLNSTLQCLAHIPPFCQSLLTLSSRNNSHLGSKGPSQGKKITFMLKDLFALVHSSNSSGSPIAPNHIVNSLPGLSNIGSRSGYRFRPGRQEDCHEFLGMSKGVLGMHELFRLDFDF